MSATYKTIRYVRTDYWGDPIEYAEYSMPIEADEQLRAMQLGADWEVDFETCRV